jgi:membrane associated rhomboid family serine protease
MSYSFGPGPMTPAVRAIIYANVAVFFLTFFAPRFFVGFFGLIPQEVLESLWLWQLGTYLFIHDPTGFMHVLFNMLAVWMFGVELERRWGTPAFVRFYLVTGVGAGLATVVVSLLPFDATRGIYGSATIGASGAVYGLILAWALIFPHRQILFMMIFPLPARVFAFILGAMSFLSAAGGLNGSVAEATHLSGLVIAWLYLKGPTNLRGELQYRLTRWRMDRMRRRFGVHPGGRKDDWRTRVHRGITAP